MEVEGVVTEFAWRNPHSFMKIDVLGKDGTTQSWTLEWGSASQLTNSQITRTTLKPGDHLVVNGRVSRDPSAHRMLLTDIKRPSDGWEWKGQAR
jgi:thiamine monophosphate kinase